MISFIFIVLAAICNSIMDVCQFHYSTSIFTKFNKPQYFDSSISWKNKYIDGDVSKGFKKLFWKINLPDFLTDVWHLAKSLMVVFLILSVVLYQSVICIVVDFVALGITWNLVFSLFYNKVLVK